MRAFVVLIEQHKEMMALSSFIRQMFDADRLDPVELTQMMSKLSGILISHLAKEDGALYPFLLRHERDEIRAITEKAVRDTGAERDLMTILKGHRRRWGGASSIEEKPEEFVAETRVLLEALETRIDREEKEIYALVTRLR